MTRIQILATFIIMKFICLLFGYNVLALTCAASQNELMFFDFGCLYLTRD